MAEGEKHSGSIREELFLQLQQLLLHSLQVGQTCQTTLLWMKDILFSWKNGDWRILHSTEGKIFFLL